MYYQGKEFIGHEFRKFLFEKEYMITAKASKDGNTTSKAILEWIHQVLGNIVQHFNVQQTYVDENDPWTGILDAGAFVIRLTTSRQKGYSPGQLVFFRNMILPIKYRVDWD